MLPLSFLLSWLKLKLEKLFLKLLFLIFLLPEVILLETELAGVRLLDVDDVRVGQLLLTGAGHPGGEHGVAGVDQAGDHHTK